MTTDIPSRGADGRSSNRSCREAPRLACEATKQGPMNGVYRSSMCHWPSASMSAVLVDGPRVSMAASTAASGAGETWPAAAQVRTGERPRHPTVDRPPQELTARSARGGGPTPTTLPATSQPATEPHGTYAAQLAGVLVDRRHANNHMLGRFLG